VIVLLRKMRVALTPRSWFLKTQLARGVIVYGKNRAGYGGRGIYIFRDSIEPEFRYVDRFLGKSGVFVDIGANTGIYTLKAAKHFGNDGIIVAIEPFLETIATLHRSVQANGFTNVRLRNLAVGAQTGVTTLWMNSGTPNSFSIAEKVGKAQGVLVLVVSLDDLYRWEKLERLDYLKIDVEGGEQEVLLGATNTIRTYRPIIQCEVSTKWFVAELPNYSVFQAPSSNNVLYIPKEHEKVRLPEELGWNRLRN